MMRRSKLLYTKVNEPADVSVWIPYTKPSTTLQTVIDCLRAQQVQPNLWKVGDDDRYWRLLKERWDEGSEFFTVEQDVFVWQGAIRILHDCVEARGWCTLPTICHGRPITTTLGCARFSDQLIAKNPGIWDDIEPTWYHLDAHFSDKMGWPYIRPHAHYPLATHLNESQWSDAISTRYTLEKKMYWQSRENGGDPVVQVKSRVAGDPEGKILAAKVIEHGEKGTSDGNRLDKPWRRVGR